MKKASLLFGMLFIFSALNGHADDDKSRKCASLKKTITSYSAVITGDAIQQAAKAATISAVLSGYQAAQCPPMSIDEITSIMAVISN